MTLFLNLLLFKKVNFLIKKIRKKTMNFIILFLFYCVPVFSLQINFHIDLTDTASKRILTMDKSLSTIEKHFQTISLENNVKNRKTYRQLLLSCPYTDNYISGVILHKETLFQKNNDQLPFVTFLPLVTKLQNRNIKVDNGLEHFAGTDNEYWTQEMDTLSVRATKFYKKGARFAKCRALFKISKEKTPPLLVTQKNTDSLGLYIRTVQNVGLVPIVECEILMEGSYTIEDALRAQEQILKHVYQSLNDNKFLLRGKSFTRFLLDNVERKRIKSK